MQRRTPAGSEINRKRNVAGALLVAQEAKMRAWGLRISGGEPVGKFQKKSADQPAAILGKQINAVMVIHLG
jgi:hypothetical protein